MGDLSKMIDRIHVWFWVKHKKGTLVGGGGILILVLNLIPALNGKGSWESVSLSLLLFVIFLLIAGWSTRKIELLREFKFFVGPILHQSSKFLFILIICFPFLLFYFTAYHIFLSERIAIDLPWDSKFWFDFIQTLLGYVLTVFVGFSIALKVSTNDIQDLLGRIAEMVKLSDLEDEIFIILPTPYLGALVYKEHHQVIRDFFKSCKKCHIAYLSTDNDFNLKQRTFLREKHEEHKQVYLKTECYCLQNIDKSKSQLWREFCDNNETKLKENALLQFHVNELEALPESQNPQKFDYFLDLVSFIDDIEKRAQNEEGITVYEIDFGSLHTFFPILVVNRDRGQVLQGTVLVESQKSVRFVGGDFIGKEFASKVDEIFKAQTKEKLCK